MNNSFGVAEKSYSLIKNTLSNYHEIKKVQIFGSRAKGNYKNGSDIDLALHGDTITQELILDISAVLNERLPIPYKIDVLAYHLVEKEELLAHINRIGIEF